MQILSEEVKNTSRNILPDACYTSLDQGEIVRSRYFHTIGGGIALLFFILACAIPSAAVPVSTQTADVFAPESLNTLIVETAVAAQTRTAVALPPTLTPTQTRPPTSTLIFAPATPTFFSLLRPSSTPLGIPLETTDPAYGVTATALALGNTTPGGDEVVFTGKPWTCAVRSSSPKGTLMQPKAVFYASWTVVNTGTKSWTSNTIDFVYKSGYRHEGKLIQDLSSTVGPGGKIVLNVLYKAPKFSGVYTATWTLKVGNNRFCGMKMTFEIP